MSTTKNSDNLQKKNSNNKDTVNNQAPSGTSANSANPAQSPQTAKPVEILDLVDLSKRLETATKNINKDIGGITKSFCRIGFELYKVRENKLYLGQDFKNVAEYGEKAFNFQKPSISNYISICERFSVKKNDKPTAQLMPEYASFNYGQLSIMLSLPAETLPKITPELPCSVIRDIKKQEKAKTELNASGSKSVAVSSSSPASSPAPVSSPSPASVSVSNKLAYRVSWLFKGAPNK